MTKEAYKPYKTIYKNIKSMCDDMRILWFEKVNQIFDAMVADKCFGENNEDDPRGSKDSITTIDELKVSLENLAMMVEEGKYNLNTEAKPYFKDLIEFFM